MTSSEFHEGSRDGSDLGAGSRVELLLCTGQKDKERKGCVERSQVVTLGLHQFEQPRPKGARAIHPPASLSRGFHVFPVMLASLSKHSPKSDSMVES